MTALIALGVAALFIASLPYWLPARVVRLRTAIFTRINGGATLQLPDAGSGADPSAQFRQAYAHPAVDGRSRGAALSDLFWYWLAPGPEMHQEHLENGPRYDHIAAFSRRVLTIPRSDIEALIDKHAGQLLARLRRRDPVRIRDLVMPLWADVYYELVFEEAPSARSQKLITDNANDVVTALKCCALRHMKKRHRLTRFLCRKLEAGEFPHRFPPGFSLREQAYYLQGTFFNTAIVQMSEAMAHLLMALAQHPEIQRQLAAAPGDRQLYDRVINETLRLYPLFGIAHRIASASFSLDRQTVAPGTVVCFNYAAYQQLGFDNPDTFDPQRWRGCSAKQSNHIPFGVAANRPCPAQGIAMISMRRLLVLLLQDYRFATAASHTRSLPNRGPCLVRPRNTGTSPREKMSLLLMGIRDRWEDVFRSLIQLVLGTVMILDARRLRLCENHFKQTQASGRPCPAPPVPAANHPITKDSRTN